MTPLKKIPGPFSAIVCAAGSSSRMGGKVRKPYLSLRGKPILAWTLAALARLPQLEQIVLVTRPDDRAMALAAAAKAKLPRRVRLDTADGGARRQDSVFNGLKATRPDAKLVLIHDAARPFPSKGALVQVCARATKVGAAILACRVRDTIKKERSGNDALIETTLPAFRPSASSICATEPVLFPVQRPYLQSFCRHRRCRKGSPPTGIAFGTLRRKGIA